MKKRTMKVLSLIVAIVMAISILPLAALADELKPTRQVGVVVYGAELTEILTGMESGVQDLQEGNVNIQGTLDSLTALVEELGTKLADGSGISVPDVDVVIVDEKGKEYKLKEDPKINIFTETTETYIPFQDDVEEQIGQIQTKLDDLKVILAERDRFGLLDKINTSSGEFTKLLDQLNTLTNDVLGELAELSGLNGHVYRTYVTDEAVPVGNYTVKVKGFSDTDAEGRAVTRDGYVLYNDGLGEAGSGYNTERYFDVTIKEKGMFDHAIQFVGPENGLAGSIDLPEALAHVYDGVVTALNKLNEALAGAQQFVDENKVAGALSNLIGDDSTLGKLIDWLKTWNTPTWKTSDQLDLSYKFVFPGLWCAESDAGFAFTNVDVAENGITGSSFLLVNRDETIDALKLMLDLGKEVFTSVLKATFGYTDEETGEQYESMLTLYTQLLKTEDGQFSIDYDVAYNIVKNYIAVIAQSDLLDKVVDTNTGDLLTPVKLRYPIPAILEATSDENGKVEFTKNSNKTLTWMLDIIPQVMAAVGKTDLIQDNQILTLLADVSTYATDLIATRGEKIINTLVYPFAQRLGLVGKKLASGKYIMFQIKAAEDYYVNPLAYTMILTWENDTWLYVTVADLGIIVPYFAEGFYDFIRNTTFAGTIDKFLSQLTGKEVNLITDILTDKIDITKELGQTVTGALTAFVGTIGFDSLGLDTIFPTRTDLIDGINTYLYENGRTAQNLMIYLNRQAQRAKSVYAGYVTEDWYFFNLDKSPTLTATKLIDKSTQNIAAAFVNPTKSGIVTSVGTSISKVVNTVGTTVEKAVQNVKTQIKSTIGAAVQSVAQKALDTVKSAVTSFFSKLFNRGMITFNA